jgi:ubiquinone/menaquinone biosynthesis C-methylase UbiE
MDQTPIRSLEKTGSPQQVRAFYDRLGGWLDTQRFYEDPALNELLACANFQEARFVYELGCGTGRLAEKILDRSPDLIYHGVDLSITMVRLTQNRLQRFGCRATVMLSAGASKIALADHTADRFVSTYVFDLMPERQIIEFLDEARRVLTSDGQLCLVSLSRNSRWLSRVVTKMWSRVHQINPMLVGGCRPLNLSDFINKADWRIRHVGHVTRLGMTSEIVVAEKSSSS